MSPVDTRDVYRGLSHSLAAAKWGNFPFEGVNF